MNINKLNARAASIVGQDGKNENSLAKYSGRINSACKESPKPTMINSNHNGEDKYVVKLIKNEVFVYNDFEFDISSMNRFDIEYNKELFSKLGKTKHLTYKPQKVFIPLGIYSNNEYSFEYKKSVNGNNILLEMKDSYIHIGSKIYEFKTINNEKILKYNSYLGNSDVPYPIAIAIVFSSVPG